MLERKFRKKGLTNFKFKETQWYKTIRNETRAYKFYVLIFALLASLIVSIAFLLIRIGTGQFELFGFYLGVILFILLETILFVNFKRIRVMSWFLLVQVVVALVASLFMEGGYALALLMISVCPLMATQLRGSVKGTFFFGGTLFVFLSAYAFQRFIFISPESRMFSCFEVSFLVAAASIIFILSFFAERRKEVLVAHLIDLLVFDETTGLPDKDVLCQSIDPSQWYILAIIKIENFSDLVALFGYEFSNIISQFASQKLKKYELRHSYKTYQLKYNEYGLLIETGEGVTANDAALRLNSILKSLELESLPWEQDRIRLVYRVGGALINPEDDRSPLSKADVALKKAERGHSVISIFENDNDERESAYKYVIRFTELINNRDNESFRAVFQPVFSADGLGIVWYEALLRIKQLDGEYTTIYPYLGVAKSTGFYQYLTDFILRKSAEAICLYDVDISVNISINDIVRPEFIALVDQVYEMTKDKKGRVIFEILESDEMVELDKCIWFIEYISTYGFKIAIDDFGTGYSNYSNLINLPVDIVKIDGSLIKKIRTDESARLLVEGIIHFCHKSNKKIVAEFVEDIHVFESLKDMKIDFLQGYYLSLPAQISECPYLPEKGLLEIPDCK
ncbi:MAG TPA: EAL domain-containing protein [Treponema sp.]|nr:EAL domain-containing protein [Treponema sp.]